MVLVKFHLKYQDKSYTSFKRSMNMRTFVYKIFLNVLLWAFSLEEESSLKRVEFPKRLSTVPLTQTATF